MVTERLIPPYCPTCMHWATTHGPDGCMYRGCECSTGQDILMSENQRVSQKKNSDDTSA